MVWDTLAPFSKYAVVGGESIVIVNDVIMTSSDESLVGKVCLVEGSKIKDEYLLSELGFKRKSLVFGELCPTIKLSMCDIVLDIVRSSYTLVSKEISRSYFFFQVLKGSKKDPFVDLWSINNPYILKAKNVYQMCKDSGYCELDAILSHFEDCPDNLRLFDLFMDEVTPERETGGCSRRVVVKGGYVFKYSRNTDLACVGQHEIELFYSLKATNHLNLPLVTVFKHPYCGLVLVFPEIEIPKSQDDPNQDSWEHRKEYLRSLSDHIYFITEDGTLVMYDGVCMYRGSLNWGYKDGLPFFFDLGECFISKEFSIYW